jgi:tetratricopeptide (TPR) repeat protein/tRNA A-37 threonylcarbamoyl transferase component Bud32
MNRTDRYALTDVECSDEREARLDAVVTAYLESRERGELPFAEAWIAQHPDLAPDLADFLASLDKVDRAAAPLRALASPPRKFGEYELLEELGQGGMGVVYKARQMKPNRLVALKMIRAGEIASPSDVQRFRNEAEAAANLDHPAIVPIYEVGEREGRLFFSMKLIENGSLARHLERLSADPRAAAALVAAIAQAVHHAHQHGVLHRDLKPANILLDLKDQPYVTDFGLAKRLSDDASLTESGMLLGTPGYMAPEQTAGRKGKISTATDVYGLGAILYALLTARPPFRGDSVLSTLQQVSSKDPDPPSTINSRVDRDLESICLKCLHKEAERRYGSAEELADDLVHWLAGEPILARPVSRTARLARWARRNPVISALTLLSAALLLVTLAGLSAGLLIIWRKDQQKEQALAKATENLAVARRAVDKMYSQFAEEWLAKQPGLLPVQKQFLRDAQEFYRQLVDTKNPDPSVRHDAAAIFVRVGRTSYTLGETAEAEQALEQAVAILDKLAAEHTDKAEYQRDLGEALKHLAWSRQALSQKTFDLARSAEVFSRLAAHYPDDPDIQSDWARGLHNLSDAVYGNHQFEEGDELNRRAIRILEEVLAKYRPKPPCLRCLGVACWNLADRMITTGQIDEALATARKAVLYTEKLKGARDSVPGYMEEMRPFDWNNLARAHITVARAYSATGRFGDAIVSFNRARAISEKLILDFPFLPRGDFDDLLVSQQGLNRLFKSQGKLTDMEANHSRGLHFLEQRMGDKVEPNSLALIQFIFAQYLIYDFDPNRCDARRAVELATKALRFAQKNSNIAGTYTEAEALGVLGGAHYRVGDNRAAIRCLKKAIDMGSRLDHCNWIFLALVYHKVGEEKQARAWFDRGVTAMHASGYFGSLAEPLRIEAGGMLSVTKPTSERRAK